MRRNAINDKLNQPVNTAEEIIEEAEEVNDSAVSLFAENLQKERQKLLEREKAKITNHANEVTSIFNTLKKQFDNKQLKEANIEPYYFEMKLHSLCEKWQGIHTAAFDTSGAVFVANIFAFEITNPLIMAIIGNSVEHFKNHYFQYIGNRTPMYWFTFACICGADKIINHLLANYELECMQGLKNSDEIIAYTATSGNMPLTEKIATLAKRAGRKDTGFLSCYDEGECPRYFIKKIENIFNGINVSSALDIPDDDSKIKNFFGEMYLERHLKALLESIKIDSSNAQCAYALAIHYRNGWDVNVDYAKSLEYFKIAANQFHAGACLELALLYRDDDTLLEIVQDFDKAKSFVEQGLKGEGIKAFDEDYFYNQERAIAKLKELQKTFYNCSSHIHTEESNSHEEELKPNC